MQRCPWFMPISFPIWVRVMLWAEEQVRQCEELQMKKQAGTELTQEQVHIMIANICIACLTKVSVYFRISSYWKRVHTFPVLFMYI